MLPVLSLEWIISDLLRYGLASLAMALSLYLAAWLVWGDRAKGVKVSLQIARVIFLAYLLGIFLIGFAPSYSYRAYHNFVPFKSIMEGLRESSPDYQLAFFTNFLVFLPMGFLLPMAWPEARSLGKVMGFSVLFCLAREAGQLIVNYGRVFDIDALILCALTTALGYGAYALGARLVKKLRNRKKAGVARAGAAE